MLIWGDTRETAEAAGPPSPLAMAMLRAARELHRAEAALRDAGEPADAAALGQAAQRAQAGLRAAVGRFCEPRLA